MLKKFYALACLVAFSFSAAVLAEEQQATAEQAPQVNFIEGTDFITKFPGETPDKPVVVEFFSYMCPHCYSTEPMVQNWLKQKPDDVELVRIPVIFGRGQWRLAAKAYYIAEELDMVKAFSDEMFSTIHTKRRPPRNEKQLAEIFAKLGVSKEQFTKVSRSFSVDSKLRRSDYLAKKYKVAGVPYFLVNYKYETAPKRFESQEALFELWNNLPKRDFQ